MSRDLPPSRTADQYVVRMPDGMRDRIAAAAKAAGRSMNSEIVARLQESFEGRPNDDLVLDQARQLWQWRVTIAHLHMRFISALYELEKCGYENAAQLEEWRASLKETGPIVQVLFHRSAEDLQAEFDRLWRQGSPTFPESLSEQRLEAMPTEEPPHYQSGLKRRRRVNP